MTSVRTLTSAAALAAVLTLSSCGSDAATDTTDTSTPSQSPTHASPPAGGGFDQGQLDQIRECLAAAGLEDAFPTEMPSGAPSDRPTDMPSDMPTEMPSDFDPENLPEGFPTDGAGGRGGGLAALQDPDVQAALDACGIELPPQPTPSQG